MDIADSGSFQLNSVGTQYISVNTSDTDCLIQPQHFQGGFKVGVGVDFDEWSVFANYTWIRQSTSVHKHAPSSDVGGTPVWVNNNWFMQMSSAAQPLPAESISSDWRLGIDLIDFLASRPFYQGRNVTISPYGGLRAAFIRQHIRIALSDIPANAVASPISGSTVSRNKSHSWALGPVFGLDAYCLLPQQFRLEGNIAASLLFTRYTRVTHKENNASTTALPAHFSTSFKNYDCLRPMLEAGLGIGWGKYIYGQKYHIDFSADYSFNFFWDQNMIRRLLDQKINANGSSASNLSLSGLTLTGRFDF